MIVLKIGPKNIDDSTATAGLYSLLYIVHLVHLGDFSLSGWIEPLYLPGMSKPLYEKAGLRETNCTNYIN